MQRFIIIIPVYNSVKYIERCLDSIYSQEYKNYEVIVVDDHSNDGTWDIVNSYPCDSFRNRERIGSGLANIIKGIELMSTDPEDVIITIDGDDYMVYINALDHLASIYNNPDVWMTYGQYFPLSGIYSNFNKPVADFSTYRKSGLWTTSHLRTFKKWLWDKIDKNDFLDSEGNYFHTAWDRAFMYPLLEMAGNHSRCISKVMYMYNDLNPMNDFRILPEKSEMDAAYIISKPEYKEV